MKTKLGGRFSFQDFEASRTRKQLNKITKKLNEEKRIICCIIDDLERSTKNEIDSVYSLIKTTWDQQNLVFILVYDKNRLINVLSSFNNEKEEKDYRKNYIQKITYKTLERNGILTEQNFNETIIEKKYSSIVCSYYDQYINRDDDYGKFYKLRQNFIDIIIEQNRSVLTTIEQEGFGKFLLTDMSNYKIKKWIEGNEIMDDRIKNLEAILSKGNGLFSILNNSSYSGNTTERQNLINLMNDLGYNLQSPGKLSINTIGTSIKNLYSRFVDAITKSKIDTKNTEEFQINWRTYKHICDLLNDYISNKDTIYTQPVWTYFIYAIVLHGFNKDGSLIEKNKQNLPQTNNKLQGFTNTQRTYKDL